MSIKQIKATGENLLCILGISIKICSLPQTLSMLPLGNCPPIHHFKLPGLPGRVYTKSPHTTK